MSQVILAALLGPTCARVAAVLREICALREDEKPHGIQIVISRHGTLVTCIELLQAMLETGFIRGPLAGQKNEAEKLHAVADYRNVFQRFFEDDVEVAMHARSISNPPQVQPVGVDLARVSTTAGYSDRARRTWWFAIKTMRSGKSHSKRPSSVCLSCPRTLSSPLTLTVVGDHHWVMVVISRPKCCFVTAIQA